MDEAFDVVTEETLAREDLINKFLNREIGLDISKRNMKDLNELSALIDISDFFEPCTLMEYIKTCEESWEVIVIDPIDEKPMFNAYRGSATEEFEKHHPILTAKQMLNQRSIKISENDIDEIYKETAAE